jgi:hypothetical protein
MQRTSWTPPEILRTGRHGAAAVVLLAGLVSGCATNGELGFAGHPLDCAVGIPHSDCAYGTPGAHRYAGSGYEPTYGGPGPGDAMILQGLQLMNPPRPVIPRPVSYTCQTFGPQTNCVPY